MFATLFHTLIYDPLYNALVFLIGIVPGADVGVAVIILTVFVKLLLFPLAHKVAQTQVIIRKIQPELDALKEKYNKKEQRQELTLKTLELYKKHNINPFFGFLIILIQLPIVLGLYWVFYQGGLPAVDTTLLYGFVNGDVTPNMFFMGITDMAGKSAILAALVGITQFIQMHIIMPDIPEKKDNPTMKDDLMRSMHMQMKYVMPIIIAITAYIISSAVALYWVTNNIFAIGQELWVRRSLKEGKTY